MLSSLLLLSLFQMTMRREKGHGVVDSATRVSPGLPRGVIPMATLHWRRSTWLGEDGGMVHMGADDGVWGGDGMGRWGKWEEIGWGNCDGRWM